MDIFFWSQKNHRPRHESELVKKSSRFSLGFTLIELLVVVSIIGLIAAVSLTSLSTARAKSRDTIRKSTLLQLRNALALYYNANGSYPNTSMAFYVSEPNDPFLGTNGGNWIPGLAPTYISALPHDPQLQTQSQLPTCNNGNLKKYMYQSSGKHYKLWAWCSLDIPTSQNDTFADKAPGRPTYYWAVTDDNTVPADNCANYWNYTPLVDYQENPACW